ncbi:MAG: tRNA guanosine(34) transglycosylase Tgt, partial [Thermodesulfobacteriota bacterium]|nr:tRNA guanosine(34) transglycosylase Tgt [Thermodesulfobacteriota bacterium]
MAVAGKRSFKFKILARDTDTRARAGELTTGHGVIPTPAFMPVGTKGSVKAMGPDDLAGVGARIVLANTYHLMVRPGHEIVKKLGGLHAFMSWPGPILTDSGGFQVFSLASLRRLTEEGVTFRSHLDGAEIFLSPEKAVAVQEALGPDIMMCLDECTPYPADRVRTAESAALTLKWARRCLKAQNPDDSPALFGIVQGGMHKDLRRRSAEEIGGLDFPGVALGGLAVGEPRGLRLEMIEVAAEVLSPERPLYLMGLGAPEDLVEGIARGADLFDCVLPTRNARNGQFFTRTGRLSIKNARFREDSRPVAGDCGCYTCRNFSRAYLRHLFVSGELLAYRLNTVHNLYYYLSLVAEARAAAAKGCFS